MHISSQYHFVSSLSTVNKAEKAAKIDETNQVEAVSETSYDSEKNPVGVYFNSWSQSDKDIFNKLTENMSGLDRGAAMIMTYFGAVGRIPENQETITKPYITADDVSVGEMLEKTLRDFTTLSGGVNLEDDIQFLQDFIKLREAGYSSVDTRA